MQNILILAESRSYIRQNCFQNQLHESLKKYKTEYNLDYFFLEPKSFQSIDLFRKKSKQYLFVLSTLRQRNLFRYMRLISNVLKDKPLRIYDQDPWENYIDDSKSKNTYKEFYNLFNLSGIYVTSNFWARYISAADNIPSTFVKMGMLPRLCNSGASREHRKKSIEFKGSLHPHRQAAFDLMRDNFVDLKINHKYLEYSKYLEYLRSIAIFVHDESGYWVCNGERIPRSSGMWVKDIEIASQGCFSIRNYSGENQTYSIDKIPLIKFYEKPADVKNITEEIFSLSDYDYNQIQSLSVQYIKENDNWKETAEILLTK